MDRIDTNPKRTPRWNQQGFTLVEMMIVLTIGAVIAMAIYRSLGAQQRHYARQHSEVAQQDALRLASAILMSSLREASPDEGDLAAIADDSVVVRDPVGFGVVCSVDGGTQSLGLIDVHGRIADADGDSALVYTPTGWLTAQIVDLDPGAASHSCPYSGGPTVQKVVQLNVAVDAVPVGAPLRAFRKYTYKLEQADGEWWLARRDGNESAALAGPFQGDGSGLSFTYLNDLGQTTTDPTQVSRVDVEMVTKADHASFSVDTLSLSTSTRNQ